MNTWIFQSTPTQFDGLDDYLVNHNPVLWRVTRSGKDMRVGDEVFIYHCKGKGKREAGVVARGIILCEPTMLGDHQDAHGHWTEGNENKAEQSLRVLVRLLDVCRGESRLTAKQLKRDPLLKNLPNLKRPQGTNYLVKPEMAEPLLQRWFDRVEKLVPKRIGV